MTDKKVLFIKKVAECDKALNQLSRAELILLWAIHIVVVFSIQTKPSWVGPYQKRECAIICVCMVRMAKDVITFALNPLFPFCCVDVEKMQSEASCAYWMALIKCHE